MSFLWGGCIVVAMIAIVATYIRFLSHYGSVIGVSISLWHFVIVPLVVIEIVISHPSTATLIATFASLSFSYSRLNCRICSGGA